MAKKFYQPTRMCVSCRKRDNQDKLFRLQCIEGSLQRFAGKGRSFYLCHDCIEDDKRVLKSLMRVCKSGEREKFANQLKEIIAHERKS